MNQTVTDDKPKQILTAKSITWFLLASIAMVAYYVFIDWGLMKVQGLNFFYLWDAGGSAG
jgi:hypothetical protein